MPVASAITPTARPPRDVQRARAELGRMQQRLAALRASSAFLSALHAVATEAAPARSEESAWRGHIPELAGKIAREQRGGLWPTEQPVRNRDRRMLVAALPPGIQVNMDDPRYS